MLKSLAALCFFAAILLSVKGRSLIENTNSAVRVLSDDAKRDARPVRHSQAKRVQSPVLTQEPKEALLEAAGLNLPCIEPVMWDHEIFGAYLRQVSDADARELLLQLIASKSLGVSIAPSTSLREGLSLSNYGSYYTKFAVVGGLLRKLSEKDFLGTLDFLDTIVGLEKNLMLSQFSYESVLRVGAEQAPEESWEVYLSKCSGAFG